MTSTACINAGEWYEGGSGSAPSMPWEQHSRRETHFDRRLSDPLNVHRIHGQGPMVDFVEAIGADCVEEADNDSQVQIEVNCIKSDGPTAVVEQEPVSENKGLSGMEGNQFSVSITDEMDTVSDNAVDGVALRQTENQHVTSVFPHELGANEEEIATEGHSQSIMPEFTPVPVEERVAMVIQHPVVEAPQQREELTEERPQGPVEEKESNTRVLCLDGSTRVDRQDGTRGDDQDAARAEVIPEEGAWRGEAAGKAQAEGQIAEEEEEGGRSHCVHGDQEAEEKTRGGPSERAVVLQEMLEVDEEPLLETSHEAMGKSSTVYWCLD